MISFRRRIKDSLRSMDPAFLIGNIRFLRRHPQQWRLPRPSLRVAAIASADAELYITSGEHTVEGIRKVLEGCGYRMPGFQCLLDFGCGAGRIIRHFPPVTGEAAELWGTDRNRAAIRWCRRNLGFAGFTRNSLRPPLHFDDGMFDFVYAGSVFTHFSADDEALWIRELHRILKPGGILMISHRGDRFLSLLKEEEQEVLQREGLVVRHPEQSGWNECDSYPTGEHIRQGFQPFFEEAVHLEAPEEFRVRFQPGRPKPGQDIRVFIRR